MEYSGFSTRGINMHKFDTDLPDSREITQVEDVMELCGRRQHPDFSSLPDFASGSHQAFDSLNNVIRETTLLENKTMVTIKKFTPLYINVFSQCNRTTTMEPVYWLLCVCVFMFE